MPPCLFAESPGAAPKRLPAIAYRTVLGPDNQFCRVLNRPWSRKVPGTGRRSGSKPPLRVSRARRWLWRDRERRRKLPSKDPALHREA